MIAAPQIEPATLADLEALAQMRVTLGWHRSDPLLRAVLGWEQGRIFVVRAGALGAEHGASGAEAASDPQALAATISAIAAGPVGVIGNVAVQAQFQRRGLGGVIMRHALAWQRAQGVQSVWLDATPDGRPLYRKLGFQPVTSSWFAYAPLQSLDRALLATLADGLTASARPGAELARVAPLDHAAFGGDRLGLLTALVQQNGLRLFIADGPSSPNGAPLGYAISRRMEPQAPGVRIGPLVATSDHAAAALTLAALTEAQQWRAPDASGVDAAPPRLFASGASDLPRARAFFAAIGMPPEDDDLVMRLDLTTPAAASLPDAADTTGRPSVYSWVSPMTF